ncbi:hypothetical protein [Streptomyces erythrochromogenes]|uniref:hypothetical protein n=1 Tax=Streptomyces erythrochromogenes TaxID=285574 RepID=UPI0033FDD1C1
MEELRVAAIASLAPLEDLDADPFAVDTRGQHAVCARWAADRGYTVTKQLLVYGMRADHCGFWSEMSLGRVDLFVAANQRVLARALRCVEEFTAECERRGVRLETAGGEEPRYTSAMKAEVHRRLSMPTAGYDGT